MNRPGKPEYYGWIRRRGEESLWWPVVGPVEWETAWEILDKYFAHRVLSYLVLPVGESPYLERPKKRRKG